MPKKKTPQIEDITHDAELLETLIADVIAGTSTGRSLPLITELSELGRYAHIIAEKSRKLVRMRDLEGYTVVVIDRETGAARKLDDKELVREIMDYKPGDVLSILNHWDVDENGNWVEKEQPLRKGRGQTKG